MWLRSPVDAINELGGRGLPPRATPTSVQRLALASVASEFASLPDCPADVTVEDPTSYVLCQDPGYVDDMTTGKPSRVQVGLVPLCSVVTKTASHLKMTLLHRSCNATPQSDLKARGNPRLY